MIRRCGDVFPSAAPRQFLLGLALAAGVILAAPATLFPADRPDNADTPAQGEAQHIEAQGHEASQEAAPSAPAPDLAPDPAPQPASKKSPPPIKFSRKGLELSDSKGNFTSRINWRLQSRYSYPFDSDPRTPGAFTKQGGKDFDFRRARFKAEGVVFRPWIEYSIEHDLVNNRLLTADVTIARFEGLQFKFGQWKANYSRERVDSSGKQQFAERSIVNRVFTLDRQKGAMVTGRLMKGTLGDSRYYGGVFSGTGRGISSRDERGRSPLLVARYQWNFLKRDVEHSQSDLAYHEKPAASLAFAAASNRGRYTRFSSSGGGQLEGFAAGDPGQYSIRQYLEETALKYRGFSYQQEFHWKRIIDHKNLRTTRLRGSYAQAGYFFHHLAPAIPKQLETAFRYAFVDRDTSAPDDLLQEFTFAVNWFFEGHSNKLTFDVSRLRLNQTGEPHLADTRYRAQWDITL